MYGCARASCHVALAHFSCAQIRPGDLLDHSFPESDVGTFASSTVVMSIFFIFFFTSKT